jgi:hypothetical protein
MLFDKRRFEIARRLRCCDNRRMQVDAVRINGVWHQVPAKVTASSGPKTIAELYPLEAEHYARLVNAVRTRATQSIKYLQKSPSISRPVKPSMITPEWAKQIEACLERFPYREHLSFRLILLGHTLRDIGAIVCSADDSGKPIGGERCRQMGLRCLRRLNHPIRFERIVKKPSTSETMAV